MFDPTHRYWLLTWTTYGTWLPGDDRGFVSPVRKSSHDRWRRQNVPGTNYSRAMTGLKNAAQSRLKCPPIVLSLPHATRLMQQFHETAEYRAWQNVAVAIMRTHVHLLVSVLGDPEPEKILQDFKAYGSRALNTGWEKPASGTWWTESGSKRKKASYAALVNSIRYVASQANPLLVWIHPDWRSVLESP